uniref:Uncharacterized protein n=1 Tax=Oryza nivara TaxID=4536 RepID=A0A0E0GXZ6_ORYNI
MAGGSQSWSPTGSCGSEALQRQLGSAGRRGVRRRWDVAACGGEFSARQPGQQQAAWLAVGPATGTAWLPGAGATVAAGAATCFSFFAISYRSRQGAVIRHGVGKDDVAVTASMAQPAMLLSFCCFFFLFFSPIPSPSLCNRPMRRSRRHRCKRGPARAKPQRSAGPQPGRRGRRPTRRPVVVTPSIGIRRRLPVGSDGIQQKPQKRNRKDASNSFLQFNVQDARGIKRFLYLLLSRSPVERRADNILRNPPAI